MTQYTVWVLTPDYERTAILANTATSRDWAGLSYKIALDDMGSCTLDIVPSSDKIQYLQPYYRLQVYRDGVLMWGGMLSDDAFEVPETAPQGETYTVSALDYTCYAQWRRVIPPAGQEQDRRAGTPQDVAKDFVYYHVGAGASAARRFVDLTVAPTGGGIPRIVEEARYDNLLTLLQKLAGNGFHWRFVPLTLGCEFRTATVWGQDRRKGCGGEECIFSLDRHSVTSLKYSFALAEHRNYLYVAGQGQGIDRNIQEVSDSAAIAAYGLREDFVDANQLTLTSSLIAKGQATLVEKAPTEELTITPTTGMFGRAWGLGDLVTVRHAQYGRTFEVNACIQAVDVTVGEAGVEYATPTLVAI